MTLDIPYYTNWFNWALTRTLTLATTQPAKLPQFLGEVRGVGEAALTAVQGFPSTRGSLLSWGPRVARWFMQHPDPFAPPRRLIERMYEQWPDAPVTGAH